VALAAGSLSMMVIQPNLLSQSYTLKYQKLTVESTRTVKRAAAGWALDEENDEDGEDDGSQQ